MTSYKKPVKYVDIVDLAAELARGEGIDPQWVYYPTWASPPMCSATVWARVAELKARAADILRMRHQTDDPVCGPTAPAAETASSADEPVKGEPSADEPVEDAPSCEAAPEESTPPEPAPTWAPEQEPPPPAKALSRRRRSVTAHAARASPVLALAALPE